MWMFSLWWCVDDHLATAFGAPGLGVLPIWVPLLMALGFATTVKIPQRNWGR